MRQVPSWDQYFMDIATAVATRSKDTTQVGTVIIDDNRHIIATGFNGFPAGMEETVEKWTRPEKYFWVVHSELGAITHCTKSLKGATLYCTLMPCRECSKAIVSSGITKVVYKEHTLNGRDYLDPISESIFKQCNIEVVQLKD
jgi:dCMP deaminase